MTGDLHARYSAAEKLLPSRLDELVTRGRVRPQWVDGRDVFRYTVSTGTGQACFEVDCVAGTKREIEPEPPAFLPHEVPSPDRKWVTFRKDFDLWVREVATGTERPLTRDGSAERPYGRSTDAADVAGLLSQFGLEAPPVVVWSPDSTHVLTCRVEQGDLQLMHLVQASPPDGARPRLRSYRYAMVGEPCTARMRLVVLAVGDGDSLEVDRDFEAPYLSPLMVRRAWWSDDASALYYLDEGRRGAAVELLAISAEDGSVRKVLTEVSDTQLQLAPLFMNHNVRVLGTGEVLWWSERSGWGHLYLYAADGTVRTLTSGEWVVRDLFAVCEQRRIAWFTAAGREEGADPYVRQIYAVSLDGGEPRRLTHDELDHELLASPSQRYAVDVASSLGTPARSVLRTLGSGDELELEVADASALYEAGWQPPERFTALAADGVTPLYGILHKPHGFDPAQSYAVLDDIYPGPQINAASVRFPSSGGMDPGRHAASMAALGFAVVVVDARGTPLRSKAFQDATRCGRDIIVEDHVAAITQLAQTRPWLDMQRVGIYGKSGGGQMSTRAMLVRPDFYRAAVSVAGDHDDATYHAMWGEKFFGLPGDFDYRHASNAALADRLEGKLLLIHGDMDDNVTPHLTIRLVDAFMGADRDVDLIIVPNADHAMLSHQAHWIRRRWDYFVRHLMGTDPPAYRLQPIPLDLSVLEAAFG